MTRYSDSVADNYGRPVEGAQVYVYDAAGALETLTDDMALPLDNPVDTDAFGSFYFNTDYGPKKIDVWFGGVRRWREDIYLGEPEDTLAVALLRADLAAAGDQSHGTLPAGASPTAIITKSASGHSGGTTDWRVLTEVTNFTGAFGAEQVSRNVQVNALHTAGTLTYLYKEQGYISLGIPSTATTTGNVTRMCYHEHHLSHTGSGTVGDMFTYYLPGPDLNVGTGLVTRFNNIRFGDLSGGTNSNRITEAAYSAFQENCNLSNYRMAMLGSELSAGANRWLAYVIGGASSFFAGKFRFGGTPTAPTEQMEVVGKVLALSEGGTIAGIGYGASAGGAVVQATSKGAAVTLNRPCGKITMHAAALAANTMVFFDLSNDQIAATDTLIVNIAGGATMGAYVSGVTLIGGGLARIFLRNMTAGSLSEAVVLNYAIIKAVVA